MDRNVGASQSSASGYKVALRKESVDRNILALGLGLFLTMSLSARRAWIEILVGHFSFYAFSVALRKESVDRNLEIRMVLTLLIRRSPQGERG